MGASSGTPERTALEKHECVACGAQAEWIPARMELACRFCGTVAPYELDADSGKVEEIDLVATLRELPDELRGWQAEKSTVRCRSCDAVTVFDPEVVGKGCSFCGAPQLVSYDEIKPPIRPQSVLPFTFKKRDVEGAARAWFKKKWLAPNTFKRNAAVDRVRGVYVPYWTFDAHVDCPWTADSGTYYWVTVMTRNSKGRMVPRRVRKVRWRPASGRVAHAFDDEPVPGTRSIEGRLLSKIEPFPTAESVPYDTGYLSGFAVEHYQVVLIDAAKAAEESMLVQVRAKCAAEVPGDTHRNLQIRPSFSGRTFKHLLVPVWILAYTYHGKRYMLIANGRTGELAGRYPKSWWKIAGLVLLGLVAAGAVALLAIMLN